MSRKGRAQLRKEMKRILSRLDKRWLGAASSSLCARLGALIDSELGRNIEHILAFYPTFPGEVDLTSFIGFQLEKRKIYLPFVDQEKNLTFVRVAANWTKNLEPGPQGILQPAWNSQLEFQALEAESTAVIIPGMAFDRDGNRLSRDRGQYDIFLARPQV